MKKLFIILLLCIPFAGFAQDNTWEKPTTNGTDAKYLAGAVPMVDGKVEFRSVIKAPGKSAKQLYEILKDFMTKLTKEDNQFEQSRILVDEPDNFLVCGGYQEWLVFKSSALQLDRTRMMYNLVAECKDGQAEIKMNRIIYYYDEERDAQTFKAEEWITDKYGLNKKQTKLARVSGKFRRKTIDRKDFLFNKIASLLK